MSKFSVKKNHEERFMVIKPDGSVRCTVSDYDFAMEIAEECQKEADKCELMGNRTSSGYSKKVMCIETGEVFESIKEASKKTGIPGHTISRIMKGGGTREKKLTFRRYEENGKN